MKIEVLVATMFRNNIEFLSKLRIKTSAVVINQTDNNNRFNLLFEERFNVLLVNSTDRGLSNSRNKAIGDSNCDICVIADDDISYVDDYDNIILNAYESLKDADLIIFDYISTSGQRSCTPISSKIKKLGMGDLLKVSSVRITFKRKSIVENNIEFNPSFGSGSTFSSGEENLFLKDCLKNKLNIYYVPKAICNVDFTESSWFSGFDCTYFETKGAFSQAMFGKFYFIYIIQFLIRKYNLYKDNLSVLKAWRCCIKGRKKYLKLNR